MSMVNLKQNTPDFTFSGVKSGVNFVFIAERGGFEPPEPTRSSTVFETAPFDHSGISPSIQAANIVISREQCK